MNDFLNDIYTNLYLFKGVGVVWEPFRRHSKTKIFKSNYGKVVNNAVFQYFKYVSSDL